MLCVVGCDKKFTSKFKLKRHILIHSQTKTFSCDICRRSFRRKDHLKNHEKVHDPGKTVYTCAYAGCARAYNSLSSFKKHQAMHSAEEGQLDCKICRAVLLSQVRGNKIKQRRRRFFVVVGFAPLFPLPMLARVELISASIVFFSYLFFFVGPDPNPQIR